MFPIPEDEIVCDPIAVPIHWTQIAGIDFGWDHPFAAAWLAHDRDNDVIYVTSDYRVSKQAPPVHAAAIRARGEWIPIAWPADGWQTEKGTGRALKTYYEGEGLPLLPEHATFDDHDDMTEQARTSVEAGVMAMLTRMQTGRWKVFRTCTSWLEEYRGYHREEGKIVKIRDDVLSASRYAYMMLRFAQSAPTAAGRVNHRRLRPWR